VCILRRIGQFCKYREVAIGLHAAENSTAVRQLESHRNY
jgi:hypothetical protein